MTRQSLRHSQHFNGPHGTSPYFMHDQVRHRVAQIMRAHRRPTALTSPVWPLLVVAATLTLLNIVTAIPPL